VRIGSLFAGIGGFDLAARWMGWGTAWFSEIDPYASAVLAKHWPGVPNHGDITQIDFAQVEPVDMLCGGFPCQPHSHAGKRKASADERDLWGEFERAIRVLRPRHVVAENVPGLLSSERGGFFARVLGDLAALGYDAEWTVLSAADVGAPHLRERVWIVAYADRAGSDQRARVSVVEGAGLSDADWGSRRSASAGWHLVADAEVIAERAGLRPSRPVRIGRGRSGNGSGADNLADAAHGRDVRGNGGLRPDEGDPGAGHHHGHGAQADDGGQWWATEPDVGRVADGVPARVDRLRGLGNAIVPQCALEIFRAIEAAEAARRVA
jgi:DNA (cytosine-5)-methyltransferase 1